MPNLKLLKIPARVFDLFFVFYLKYNYQYCLEKFTNRDDFENDKEHYNEILGHFNSISDELYVFFHAIGNGQCFMQHNYFNKYKNLLVGEYDLNFVKSELSDHKTVIRRLIKFYFHDVSDGELDACFDSDLAVFELVRRSSYNDTEKSRLYEFFIDPVFYIQKLQYELMEKDLLLNAYYEKNYDKILDLFGNMSYESLRDGLGVSIKIDFIEKSGEDLYVSICLVNKNCINLITVENGAIYLLGTDCFKIARFFQNYKKAVKLNEFGSALADESRIKMLDLMKQRGELTCKELEKSLNFSPSTAYHHLTTMLKYGAIKSRNEGKVVFYSINEKYFDDALAAAEKYTTKGVSK